MEQHPIPQNISGFQFKLIGDITLKQFAYMAGGIILGYLSIKFTLLPSIMRWPFAGFWVIFGFCLAFVPIEERPLDRWLTAFFKNMYAPTQFVWKKNNLPPQILLQSAALDAVSTVQPTATTLKPNQPPKTDDSKSPLFRTPIKPITGIKPKPAETPMPVTPKPPSPPPPPRPIPPSPTPNKNQPTGNWWTVGAPPIQKPTPAQHPTAPMPTVTGKRVVFQQTVPVPSSPTAPPNTKQVEKIKSDYQQVEKKLTQQIQSLQGELQQGTIAKERFMELQQVLGQLLNEKERLSMELQKLRQQLEAQNIVNTVKPSEYTTAPTETVTTVKMVSPAAATRAGIPTLTSSPNVVTGIIKDSRGNLLPNLIVTVKDKDNMPVRALKTNKLGQFAASTPLVSGRYFIEIEDPKTVFKFNRIEVNLTNQVLPPLEISAVSERDIMRQKLTQELFGKNSI